VNTPLRCAPAAELRGDPLHGTAAPAQRFVLVERPGAWGRNALHDSRLDEEVVRRLLARCRALDARLLLIRRAHRDPSAPRRYAVVDARSGREQAWWGSYEDETELAGLELENPVGAPTSEPLLLVCTHGRRDACCARRGWPVVVALTEAFPEWTWQCSHVGGDRFAANLLILPHGLYYGHVAPDEAVEVVRSYREGLVVPDKLRGRSIHPTAVQSAQHFARLALDDRRLGSLEPVAWTTLSSDRVSVRLAHEGRGLRVAVRRVTSEPIERLTCGASSATRVHRYVLEGIDVS